MNKSKLFLLVALVVLVSVVFIGCEQIPEEYTEGVRLERSYPEDDMPIYDDAVVYYFDDDESEISIKYGVKDDLEDVAEFYKDHFENNEIVLEDETDKSTRYSAEGSYNDFKFQVKVTVPSGDYEEKLFTTIVKVDIEFVDDSLGPISDLQDDEGITDKLIGFWRQESYDNANTHEYGIAYEFLSDGSLNLYMDFKLVGTGGWSEIDSSTVLLTSIDGSQENVTVTLEKRSEKDYLVWKDSTGILVFFKDSKDGFSMESASSAGGDSNGIPPSAFTDDQLASAISDTTWHYIAYVDNSGDAHGGSEGNLTYNSDGSFEDIFNDETQTGNWYVKDGRLNCDYSDSTSASWPITIELRGSADYLVYYDEDEEAIGAYWLYSTFPPNSIITYTTDEEMTSAIAGKDFNSLYYMYADGTIQSTDENPITFNADNTLEDLYEGELFTGTWAFADGYLENTLDNGEAYHYPAYVEYNSVTDSYYLFLGDLGEGFENCYWVYTTYQP